MDRERPKLGAKVDMISFVAERFERRYTTARLLRHT